MLSLLIFSGCSKDTVEEPKNRELNELQNQVKQLKIENSKLKIEKAKLLKEVQSNRFNEFNSKD